MPARSPTFAHSLAQVAAALTGHGVLARSPARHLGVLVLAVLTFVLCRVAPACADEPLRVQAASALEDLERFDGEGFVEVRGRLVDDTQRPIGGAELELEVGVAARLRATDCLRGRPLPRSGAARRSRHTVVTTSEGAFCARLIVTRRGERPSLELSFRGDAYHLPLRRPIPTRAREATLELAFAAPSLELPLERPVHRIVVEGRLEPAAVSGTRDVPLELLLEGAGRRARIGSATWSVGSRRVVFEVRSELLGAPGPARLVVRHLGSNALPPSSAEAVALRLARVRLEADVKRRDDQGVLLEVRARSVAGLSPPGWVEAASADGSLGTAGLEAGKAELWLALPGAREEAHTLTLTYLAQDPWWVADAPLTLELPPARSTPPTRWPWLVLLVPIAFLFVRALERPGRSVRPSPAVRAAPPAVAEVELVEPARTASGWTGTVRDAHDGTLIAGARLAILTSDGQPLGPSAISDAAGRFRLEPVGAGDAARLSVSGPLHSELLRPLPPEGRLAIALVSRRRTLLRRLVDWARAAGAPWTTGSEPTPGEVVDVALRRNEPDVAEWARAVEAAAFGEIAPDETREAALRAREPTWGQRGARKR